VWSLFMPQGSACGLDWLRITGSWACLFGHLDVPAETMPRQFNGLERCSYLLELAERVGATLVLHRDPVVGGELLH
jgi:hypothetical protein